MESLLISLSLTTIFMDQKKFSQGNYSRTSPSVISVRTQADLLRGRLGPSRDEISLASLPTEN